MTRFEIALSVAAGCVSLFAVIESLFGLPAAVEPWVWRVPVITVLGVGVCALLTRCKTR